VAVRNRICQRVEIKRTKKRLFCFFKDAGEAAGSRDYAAPTVGAHAFHQAGVFFILSQDIADYD